MVARATCAVLALALLAVCSGGDSAVPAFDYGGAPALLRVGEPFELAATTATGSGFDVSPALPAGLSLDAADGTIRGTPTATVSLTSHVVTGRLGEREVTAVVQIAVGPALPAEIAALERGFCAQRLQWLTEPPGKFAPAPDGRIFVTERSSGVIRILAADGTLQATPFATVPVTTGGHRGLLGLALSPAFATDGRVFAMATTPAGGGKPERSVLYRFTEVAGVGTAATVLLDDLPVAGINNGGALCFDHSGMLIVSIGDTEDPSLSQSDPSLAGKLLRIDPDTGASPPDNPVPGSPVYAKGLRNVWALCVDPLAGSLFAADNGPANDDELLLVQPGRNFEWGAPPGASFGAATGVLLRLWPDVVVPTGLSFARADLAPDWPAAHLQSLFLALYDEETVLRLEMSGTLRTDIDREVEFLRFSPSGVANKPVDIQLGPQGELWVLTFAAVYRIDRIR